MNIKKITSILMMMVIGTSLAHSHPQIKIKENRLNDTLCQDDEDIYLNAGLENGKIVSLCGYQHYSPDTGYVKYRYGTLNKVELEYPSDKKPPRGRFLTHKVNLGPNVQGQWIFFYIGDYQYALTYVASVCAVTVSDVSSKRKKKVFGQYCAKKSFLKNGLGYVSDRLIYGKKVYSKFPEQHQDPNESDFHKSSWLDEYNPKQ